MSLYRFYLPLVALAALPAVEPLLVTSPDGRLRAEVVEEDGFLRYRVFADGAEILKSSDVGLQTDHVRLGKGAVPGTATITEISGNARVLGGKARAHYRARQATIPMTTGAETWTLEVQVANEGVAVRTLLPARPGRQIQADHTSWRLPGDVPVWGSYRDNPCYENLQFRGTLATLTVGKTLDLPLTAQVGNHWVTLTEAALRDYADFGIAAADNSTLAGRLVADTKGWTTQEAVVQPWRVAIIAQDLTGLVNSTLVQDLNPPPRPDLVEAPWIRPGRSTWQWMSSGAPVFADQSQWIAWTKALGFEYYLVDDGWHLWKDGDRDAWACMKSVCDEAKANGVAVWLWVHSDAVKDSTARKAYFDQCVAVGAVGVKIDFMPPTDRWWSTWYEDTARDAADRRLMVNFHGTTKPTGMERTWPNEMSREGVRGHEWQMSRHQTVLDTAHSTILPFTRYLAGHGDFTPTAFDPKELQGNSWGHELAQAVVFTSPYLCFGGHPKDYLANPGVDVLKMIPAAWDETRILPGTEPGKRVLSARRTGSTWFVGVLGGPEASQVTVDLTFLGQGRYNATILGDDSSNPAAWDRREVQVTPTDQVSLQVRAKGGAVIRLTPSP